ncbi:MAG: sulfatase-like hydrolase/transferase, partial [Candidatus Marinimicrobia bacterium]|nr:sulfatase-like hydrolase/transferase [Candidatus Neomarinimicrobiota bacterium]
MKTVGLGTAALALSRRVLASKAAAETPAPRPNILWISTEDISPDLGCYGDPYAVTPNLDRFAAQGTRFSNAFAHAGVCAPARSGIITGMYLTTIGTNPM